MNICYKLFLHRLFTIESDLLRFDDAKSMQKILGWNNYKKKTMRDIEYDIMLYFLRCLHLERKSDNFCSKLFI